MAATETHLGAATLEAFLDGFDEDFAIELRELVSSRFPDAPWLEGDDYHDDNPILNIRDWVEFHPRAARVLVGDDRHLWPPGGGGEITVWVPEPVDPFELVDEPPPAPPEEPTKGLLGKLRRSFASAVTLDDRLRLGVGSLAPLVAELEELGRAWSLALDPEALQAILDESEGGPDADPDDRVRVLFAALLLNARRALDLGVPLWSTHG